jgi:hypothetical protein
MIFNDFGFPVFFGDVMWVYEDDWVEQFPSATGVESPDLDKVRIASQLFVINKQSIRILVDAVRRWTQKSPMLNPSWTCDRLINIRVPKYPFVVSTHTQQSSWRGTEFCFSRWTDYKWITSKRRKIIDRPILTQLFEQARQPAVLDSQYQKDRIHRANQFIRDLQYDQSLRVGITGHWVLWVQLITDFVGIFFINEQSVQKVVPVISEPID